MKDKNSLTAKFEAFDSFWEGPSDIEKGYTTLCKFYKYNYMKFVPQDKDARILVVSCGPGYFLYLLKQEEYSNVLGIDSDPEKIKYAKGKGLNCEAKEAFPFLSKSKELFDAIICEQEVNHLAKEEILMLFQLCWKKIKHGGILIVHALNGANPITGSEALAQNFDHYNTCTEYSLRQLFKHSKFVDIKVIPLNLYVFYNNPLNYVALFMDKVLALFFRFSFALYGKSNKIFTKKIAGIGRRGL